MHAKISNKPYQILNRDIIKYIAMFRPTEKKSVKTQSTMVKYK